MSHRILNALGVLILVIGRASAQPAMAAEATRSAIRIEREIGATKELSLEVGQTRLMESSTAMGRVSVANPEVADLKVVTNTQLLVTAKGVGDTFLTLWDKSDKPLVMSLHVTRNLESIRRQMKELFPNEAVNVSAAGELVVLSGEVSDVRLPERILSVARLYAPKIANLLQVRGNQQVQLEVKFAEVSRTGLREMGLNWFHNGSDRVGGMVSPSQGVASFAPVVNPAVPPVYAAPFGNAFSLFYSGLNGSFPFSIVVSLLEQNSLAKTLAEPTLVAMSGQEARFLAGGEFPIPIASTLGQQSVEFKKFGIQLKFTPTVLAEGLVSLHLASEVSEIDQTLGLQVSGFLIPGLTSRQSETTVRMRDGQSFVIAGLLSDKVRSVIGKLPGLGQIPILGALFRSTQFRQEQSELLVVVTTRLVHPVAAGEAPRLPGWNEANNPNDLELFLLGKTGNLAESPAKRGEAIPVPGDHLVGPVGDLGFMRRFEEQP